MHLLGRRCLRAATYCWNQRPVLETIITRLPVTASVAIGAAVLWVSVGISIGIASARRPGSLRDRLGTTFVLIGLSFPTFVFGLLLLYFLFFRLTLLGIEVFPAAGYVPLTESPLEWARHLILPWITIAFVTAATYARLTRGQMLEVLGEDYIRTARAKGLSERRVIYRHGLRSAVTPLFTQFGLDVALILGGLVVTEQVFGLPGIGRLAVDSVIRSDQPVIIGIVLFATFAVVVANVFVDLGYAVLDARVRIH